MRLQNSSHRTRDHPHDNEETFSREAMVAGVRCLGGRNRDNGSCQRQPFAATWSQETANGSQVFSSGAVDEAYNGSTNHMDVWRGQSGNGVWFSYNNGPAFQVGTAQTFNQPTVVAYGNGNYAVFHVGVDNNVYWSRSTVGTLGPGNPASWTPWSPVDPIGGVAQTGLPVAVTQLSVNTTLLFMVWRGNGSDTSVYGSYFDGGAWNPVQSLGGSTLLQPSITFNPDSQALWVSVRGGGGGVWLNSQNLGSSNWNGWFSVGLNNGTTALGGPVTFAAHPLSLDDTSSFMRPCMILATTDSSQHVWFNEVNPHGTTGNWIEDPSGFQTSSAVNLSSPKVASAAIFAILNGISADDWWALAQDGADTCDIRK